MFIRMKESKGFTLVELMIVVAIIGILAAVAVPYYQKYIQKSRLTSLVFPGVHAIETNVATFYSLNSAMPTGTSWSGMVADADSTYFSVAPPDAQNNIVFTIRTLSTATSKQLDALKTQQLSATPQIPSGGGIISSWSYGLNIATIMGISGVQ